MVKIMIPKDVGNVTVAVEKIMIPKAVKRKGIGVVNQNYMKVVE